MTSKQDTQSSEQERYDLAATAGEMSDTDPEVRRIMEGGEVRAGFKIEIMFGARRTAIGPNLSVIQVWESGKRLHGGGDELVYWCKDLESDSGCWGPITGSNISSGLAFCKNCGTVRADRLTGQRFMRVTSQKLGEHVAMIWRQLGSNADIYCKYDPNDIRVQIMEKKLGSIRAHALRGLFIYPLKNILKDTADGMSNLEARFNSFFRA